MLCTLVVLVLFAFFFFLPTMNLSPLHFTLLAYLISLVHITLTLSQTMKTSQNLPTVPSKLHLFQFPQNFSNINIPAVLISAGIGFVIRYSGTFQTATCVTCCFCFLTTIFYHSQVASLKNTSLIFIYIKYLSPSFLLHLLLYYFFCPGCMQ